MSEDEQLSPLGAEMVAGLSAFCDALASGKAIDEPFTVRTVRLDLSPKKYEATDIKNVRIILKASQALLAQFLGVSVKSIRAWEQGTKPIPAIACRFLDEIIANPDMWRRRLSQSLRAEAGEHH